MSKHFVDPSRPRVLVLGRRKRLEAALRRRRVPYALWLDREPAVPPRKTRFEVAPFPATRAAVEKVLDRLSDAGPFTHCIASVEAAVVAASHARRILGARRSAHTIARRCRDKLVMKQTLRAAGIAVTDFLDLNRPEELLRVGELGRPIVIKDRVSSGSRGIELVDDPSLVDESHVGRKRIAERFVVGEEMSVESFTQDGRVVWSSTTRYWRPKHVNVVPSGLDPEALAEVVELNRRAIEALSIRWGMTHLELFRTEAGPVVGEIALRPPGGYIMRCLELAWGFDPWEALCAVELGDQPELPPGQARPTAAVVLHPGPGTVARIAGLDEVRAHPAHVESRLKVQPGSRIPARVGVGDDIGHVVLQADDDAALDAAIRFVDERLVVELSG